MIGKCIMKCSCAMLQSERSLLSYMGTWVMLIVNSRYIEVALWEFALWEGRLYIKKRKYPKTLSIPIGLLDRQRVKPSIHPIFGLPLSCPPLTSNAVILFNIRHSSILSTCPNLNHLNPFCLALFDSSNSTRAEL